MYPLAVHRSLREGGGRFSGGAATAHTGQEPWNASSFCPEQVPVRCSGRQQLLLSCRALDVLKDFAPGAQLPVLLYNGDSKTDTVTIEDFLEARLAPPASVAGTALRRAKEGWRR